MRIVVDVMVSLFRTARVSITIYNAGYYGITTYASTVVHQKAIDRYCFLQFHARCGFTSSVFTTPVAKQAYTWTDEWALWLRNMASAGRNSTGSPVTCRACACNACGERARTNSARCCLPIEQSLALLIHAMNTPAEFKSCSVRRLDAVLACLIASVILQIDGW